MDEERRGERLRRGQVGQQPKTAKGTGITLAETVDRYLTAKARKPTTDIVSRDILLANERRHLDLFRAVFGAEAPLGPMRGVRSTSCRSYSAITP